MPYYLKCKKIETAIRRAKKMLVEKVEKEGLYENFGMEEYRTIKNHFIDLSDYTDDMNERRRQLQSFSNWAGSYQG